MENLFAVYKPKGPTSNDVVGIIKRYFDEKKVGHAGTLDPLASGVLVIGVGRDATKQLGKILEGDKEYIAEIYLGATSETDDSQGPITRLPAPKVAVDGGQVKKILPKFTGTIQQMPPKYSSIKRGGVPAHKLARQGRKVLLGARTVEINEIEILEYNWPILKIRVATGSGAYIRSLARDIGEELKVGGYLKELERTRVGQFDKKYARLLDEFKKS